VPGQDLAAAVGSGLLRLSLVVIPVELLVHLTSSGGLLEVHLGWGAAAQRSLRRGVRLVQLLVLLEWTSAPGLLWFIFGATGTTGVVVFSVLARAFPPGLAGRASTAQNLLIFAAAFALQWGMGEVINIWPVAADGAYSVIGYRAAFGVALALQAAAFVWMVVYRPRAVLT